MGLHMMSLIACFPLDIIGHNYDVLDKALPTWDITCGAKFSKSLLASPFSTADLEGSCTSTACCQRMWAVPAMVIQCRFETRTVPLLSLREKWLRVQGHTVNVCHSKKQYHSVENEWPWPRGVIRTSLEDCMLTLHASCVCIAVCVCMLESKTPEFTKKTPPRLSR